MGKTSLYDPANDMTDDEIAAWQEYHINSAKDPLF